MSLWVRAVIAATLAALCLPAFGADAPTILRQAYAAEKMLAYSAVLEVRTAGGPPAELKVWSSRGRKRMEYLSEPARGRVMIDDGHAVYWLDKAGKVAVFTPAPDAPERVDLVFRNYNVASAGTDEVAGRKAIVVRVSPKHPPGPSRRLWIDQQTKLILRSESYASDGTLKAASKTTSINLRPQLSEDLFRVPKGWRVQRPPAEEQNRWTAAELSKRLGITVAEPGYVPPGFVLEGMYLVRMGGMGRQAAHVRYVDGLNSLSIFQRPAGPGPGRGRGGWGGWRWRGGRGADTDQDVQSLGAVGRLVRVFRPGRMCVVVADLPEKELQKVASSLP